MGTISLQIPVAGQPNSTEDAKVASDFTTIQTWANGNVDTNNLSPTAGIVPGQLAATSLGLVFRSVSVSATANDADLIQYTGVGGHTITLPGPTTANLRVGVFVAANLTGANPLNVTTPSGVIAGIGVAGASITLGSPNAYVLLQSNGVNWVITSGARDTGWTPISGGVNIGAAGGMYLPSSRTVGDRTFLRGGLVCSTGVGNPYTWGTLNTAGPTANIYVTFADIVGGTAYATTGGAIAPGSPPTLIVGTAQSTGSIIGLDGVNFTIN